MRITEEASPQSVVHIGKTNAGVNDWPMDEDKKQRKKIQNRINQRAHRRRKAAEQSHTQPSKPFRVVRFRVENSASKLKAGYNSSSEEPPDLISPSSGVIVPVHSDDGLTRLSTSSHPPNMEEPITRKITFPLSSDHLLHLIHHTVFRALTSNKEILRGAAKYTRVEYPVTVPRPYSVLCGAYTIVTSENANIPKSLIPTKLQMTQPHSSWIDMFPYERLRDNLIIYEDHFDHTEMCKDLFGEVMSEFIPDSPKAYSSRIGSGVLVAPIVDEDAVTAERKGLINWGEPYDKQSWEATPGFIEKWSWTVDGVDELIESSNRWRAIRGEEPIRVSFL
ncbi:hypothetical protein PVAG01_10710 [Phlyctema vagabunda]|uniref:BZIP domain-containing protein n=1 Tax=Phlyctema vagabunda TaxID=108571 RepID=A0ABR4P354_9HELO